MHHGKIKLKTLEKVGSSLVINLKKKQLQFIAHVGEILGILFLDVLFTSAALGGNHQFVNSTVKAQK
jgi:hypothetical protein